MAAFSSKEMSRKEDGIHVHHCAEHAYFTVDAWAGVDLVFCGPAGHEKEGNEAVYIIEDGK